MNRAQVRPRLRAAGWVLLIPVFLGADWPQFRGTNGVSADPPPPLEFSADKNLSWKVALPAKGPSSPIVVGERVFVTCSGGAQQERLFVLALDAKSGSEAWRREFWATGRTFCHPSSGNAAPTPASDGKRIFAFFSSNDLICLDLDGNLLWYRGLAHDYPKAGNDVGMASSPLVIGETVIVQVENEGDSFAAGLDTSTGETRWRVARDRAANWASPTRLPGGPGESDRLLLQSGSGLTALDPRSGEVLWQHDAPAATIATAAALPSRVFLPANGLTVLDTPASGSPQLLWQSNQLRPGPACPVTDGEFIYAMNSAGVLACAGIADGKILWQLRVGGSHWATPLIAGGHMYCINQEGKLKVVQLGAEGKIVGEGDFGESIQASPAAAQGALYVRSDRHLWRIAHSR